MNAVTTNPPKVRRFLAAVALEEEAIRARIREARKEAGLTQAQLSELLTVHRRTVEEWENSYVPWQSINDIARVTGKTPEWILHGDDPAPAELEARLERIEEMLGEALRRLPPAKSLRRAPRAG